MTGLEASVFSSSVGSQEEAYTGQEDELRAICLGLMGRDEVVGVCVGEVETRAGTPVTKQSRLDVLSVELPSEESIASEEDLYLISTRLQRRG
jgi:hypothetical protein